MSQTTAITDGITMLLAAEQRFTIFDGQIT